MRYTDPTGHMQASDDYQDSDGKCGSNDKGCNDLVKRIKDKQDKAKKDEGKGKRLTNVDKVGIGLTAVLMDGIVGVSELSMVAFQLAMLDTGPVGVAIDVAVIAPAELAVGDFGLSFSLMAVEEISTGQTQEFKWTVMPALFSSLPSDVQHTVLQNIPDPLYKILTNKNP